MLIFYLQFCVKNGTGVGICSQNRRYKVSKDCYRLDRSIQKESGEIKSKIGR